MPFCIAATDPRVILKLASRGVERVRKRDVDILVACVAGHGDHAIGHRNLDAHVELPPLPVVAVRLIYDDVRRENPIVDVEKTVGPLASNSFDRGTRRHAEEPDF